MACSVSLVAQANADVCHGILQSLNENLCHHSSEHSIVSVHMHTHKHKLTVLYFTQQHSLLQYSQLTGSVFRLTLCIYIPTPPHMIILIVKVMLNVWHLHRSIIAMFVVQLHSLFILLWYS